MHPSRLADRVVNAVKADGGQMTALTAPRRGDGRKDIDYRLIAALVMGASLRHAAEQVDVSVSADERRLADPEFRVRLVEAKNDLMDRRLGASASAGLAAIDHLLQVVVGDVKPSPGRIAAARALLGASVSLGRHTSGRLP